MFEKQVKKGKEWATRNKSGLIFGFGVLSTVCAYKVFNKINEPKLAAIEYSERVNEKLPTVTARVFCKNRFGMERKLIGIKYEYQCKELKELTDNLNSILYPGD